MIKKMMEYCNKHHMIAENDKIVAGVSGGADSVCLLFMLLDLRKTIPFELAVVHVEHGVRGAEAMEDEKFVRKLCEEYKLSYYCFHEDIKALSKQEKITLEEAGRKVRYQAFEAVCREWNGDKIAVAHNKNDQAETMLFHLFRGTGLKGLAGIAPVRGNVIRPLLCFGRKEIETYLHNNNICYITDKTNDEDDYTRNKIRHHIIPYAEKEIQQQVITHMWETAKLVAEADSFIRQQAEALYQESVIYDGDYHIINLNVFLKNAEIIQKYVIRICIEKIIEEIKNISNAHIKEVIALAYKEVGKRVNLPYGIMAVKGYSSIYLGINGASGKKCTDEFKPMAVKIPGSFSLSKDTNIEFSLENYEKNQIISEKSYTKWFDYDKIKSGLCLRSRKQGDYLCINEALNKQTLKSYLINVKIPKDERDSIVLLTENSHVIWAIGYRISELYKATEKTKVLLKVQVRGGIFNE